MMAVTYDKNPETAGRVLQKTKERATGRGRRSRSRARNLFRAAAVATSLAVGTIMPMKSASAEEVEPAQEPKPAFSLRAGVGADFMDSSQTRPVFGMDAHVPLPRGSLDMGFGLSPEGPLPRTRRLGLEDFMLDIGVPLYGPVGVDAYAYNDRHLGVGLAAGGDVWAKAGSRVTLIAGAEKNIEGPVPVFGIAKIEAVKDMLTIMPQFIWVTNRDVVGGRLRGSLRTGEGLPEAYADVLLLGSMETGQMAAATMVGGLRMTF